MSLVSHPVLAWLERYGLSTSTILQQVAELHGHQAQSTLRFLEQQGAIVGGPADWRLSPRQRACASGPVARIPAQRQRTHHQLLQQLELAARSHGIFRWQEERQCRLLNWGKIPDALFQDLNGTRVAVELELTLKTRWRYEDLITQYAQLFAEQKIDQLLYVVPIRLVSRIRAILDAPRAVVVQDRWWPVTDALRQRWHVQSLPDALLHGPNARFLS